MKLFNTILLCDVVQNLIVVNKLHLTEVLPRLLMDFNAFRNCVAKFHVTSVKGQDLLPIFPPKGMLYITGPVKKYLLVERNT